MTGTGESDEANFARSGVARPAGSLGRVAEAENHHAALLAEELRRWNRRLGRQTVVEAHPFLERRHHRDMKRALCQRRGQKEEA